jgi:uncharacterized membrane protein YccC
MKAGVTSASGGRPAVQDWIGTVVPDWLAEVAVPKKVPPPWGAMARSVIAIWVPLAAGIITGHLIITVLPAMGGLMSVMVDSGGTLRARVRRVSSAAVLGGAPGLAAGSAIHGRGWVAVIAIVAVAGLSSLLARLGGTGSVTGLQFMVYSAVSLGPLGALRPWWHTALEFFAGVAWALLLLIPGWLLSPRAAEQHLIADVYHRIADDLRAAGTPGSTPTRQQVTAALNAAYDAVLTGRSASSGRARQDMRLTAILNASHPMAEACGALRHEGERPPRWVTDTIDRLADAIAGGGAAAAVPIIPPPWSGSDGAMALRDSMVALARLLSAAAVPEPVTAARRRPGPAARARARAGYVFEQLIGGRVAWTFTIRLMLCTAVAAVMSEVLPLTRSYWVVLTVAVVLKPDYGSVFSRALQRGIGTILGAALGAVILAVVPYGPWLLIPFGILAALLPYGKARSFGLSAVFLTPFVVLLIDLLERTGWHLAGDRAVDTILGSAIVLLVGYAPWSASWQAHLPGQFAQTLRAVCAYLDEALLRAAAAAPSPAGHPGGQAVTAPALRSRLRRQAFRSLADLRAEFQRTMSEPQRISRRAAAWWPAVVGLEELLDAATAASLAISRGAPEPAAASVHQLTGTLRAVADTIEAGLPPRAGPLPAAADLSPVTQAAREVLSVLIPSRTDPGTGDSACSGDSGSGGCGSPAAG